MSVFDKVKKCIVEQLGVDEEEVTMDASITDDLGADSLDQVELVMALETEFNLDIPDEEAEKIKTVGDAVKYIESVTEKACTSRAAPPVLRTRASSPMFDSLSDRLSAIFRRLRSRGKLTEPDVAEVLREIRIALLEADVNLQVVKDFIASIRERAIGAEVLASLTPAQAIIAIVRDGLVELLGGQTTAVRFAPTGVTPVVLAGLQGSGKTTQAAKLALRWKDEGRRP